MRACFYILDQQPCRCDVSGRVVRLSHNHEVNGAGVLRMGRGEVVGFV
jgi:hypothetical protein